MYEAKTAQIGNFWIFWPIFQLINHLLKIWQAHFCPTVMDVKTSKVLPHLPRAKLIVLAAHPLPYLCSKIRLPYKEINVNVRSEFHGPFAQLMSFCDIMT